MINILLADDHEVVLAGLKQLFTRHEDLTVVGEACDGNEACKKAVDLRPDVVVMDLSMPRVNGIEATRRIKESCPEIKVTGLSMHEDRPYLMEFLRAGGSGFVPKRAAAEEIVKAVRVVAAGGFFVESENVSSPLNKAAAKKDGSGRPYALSEREADVVRYVARGHTNKEIAEMLGVSIKTVETYKARSMAKLKVKSRSDLVRYALLQGWLEAESVQPVPAVRSTSRDQDVN